MFNARKYLPIKVSEEFLTLYSKFSKIFISGCVNTSCKSFFIGSTFKDKEKSIIWIVNDITEKEIHKKMIEFWTDFEVYDFSLEENDYNNKTVSRKNNGEILTLISKITEPKKQIILLTYKDFLTFTPLKESFNENIWVVRKNLKISLVNFFEKLISLNYHIAKSPVVNKGEYYCKGNIVTIFPFNTDYPVKIVIDFDEITDITFLDKEQKNELTRIEEINLLPILKPDKDCFLTQYISSNNLIIEDEIEIIDDFYEQWIEIMKNIQSKIINFVTFHEDEDNHKNLQIVSTVKFHSLQDFVSEIKDKKKEGWQNIIFSKHPEVIKNIFNDKKIIFQEKYDYNNKSNLILVGLNKDLPLPTPFQIPSKKISVITDKDLSFLTQENSFKKNNQSIYLDLLTSLKYNDLVVHSDHGIARFLGLEKKTVNSITKEYLKLGYAENDKLFIPIDQADKVSKYIGAEELAPKLTRLGSAEWVTVTNKIKAETKKIAKELLELYAARKAAKGIQFLKDDKEQEQFEQDFGYTPTPGQIKAIVEVKKDMESLKPMDRLVCGDVGFGKTEVAIRAAFKAAKSKKQVAFISPITILADQHYQSFQERMEKFNIRIDMISRFKTKKEQKEILLKLAKGEIDVIIGTHRLIQEDVQFKNLGLVIIDEEQRFGVQQKEKLKELRKEVDILTLTATPIPRTLNICLNKLRDISTITTPPPGRLPIITEVRKYSESLIKEAIEKELDRGGQIYFLHNKVQTIDSVASKLKLLIPKAKFIVAHGQLSPAELEKRIIAFKHKEYDVLVSSTIIENGIDLPNANTLIVNNAEKFGLAQLYQLRGRVGRGQKQAYAYFLYHGQRLKLDAKKRLRAIVEASELGSGFQIAMKDLEIRGAGEILGANQAGAMQVVGVSHFIRMLNKTVEEMQSGIKNNNNEPTEISIELPINAYIPEFYIPNTKDKIATYQKLSSADTLEYLKEIKEEVEEEYGKIPGEVLNLFKIIKLKIYAKKANLLSVKLENPTHSQTEKIISITLSDMVKPENIISLLDYNNKWQISGNKLKITLKDLGVHWFTELIQSINALRKNKKPETTN